MGHLKYKAYERGKSGNRRLEGHSTLFGINISLNCARDNFLFNGDAHFSLVSVSKFHGPRVNYIQLLCGSNSYCSHHASYLINYKMAAPSSSGF